MKNNSKNLSREWIIETREDFRTLLSQANLSCANPLESESDGYPDWLVMYIAILATKLGLNDYKAIHQASSKHWDIIAADTGLSPMNEQQLTDHLKKIQHFPEKPATFISQLFPDLE